MAPPDSATSCRDIALCSMVVLVKFGDSVEMFLPGVITQVTSCDLGVGETEEAFLGIIMYIAMAVATLLSEPISGLLSKRTTVLGSLYISIIATVTCSLVHNYTTLLISRMFVGFCVGLNISSMKVLFSTSVSSAKAADTGLFLANFAFALGSGWVSILGYLFLDMLGWRNLILIVSIPWFIPPIIMFHLYLTPAFFEKAAAENEANHKEDTTKMRVREIWSDSVIRLRLLKIGGLNFLLMLFGGGTILLFPELLKATNLASSTELVTGRCAGTVGGTDFLLMAAITGGVNAIGRPFGYYIFKKTSFRCLMAFLGCLVGISYAVIMAWDFTQPDPNLILICLCIAVITGAGSMQINEAILSIHDHDIFPATVTAHTSAVCWFCSFLGTTVGNSVSAFTDVKTAVQINFGLSFLQIALSSTITERISNKDKPKVQLQAEADENTLLYDYTKAS